MRTFRDFMEEALYDPERGFYQKRTPTQDFYTAPELHPAFGAVLAREIARRFDELKAAGVPGPYSIVEMGSGEGKLARAVLTALRSSAPAWAASARYVLVERARQALLDSVVGLSADFDRVIGYSRLDEVLPCAGVFLSNELVDAFPIHLLEKRDGRVFEVYVEESGRTLLSDLSTDELKPHAQKAFDALSDGERHAVNLEAGRWLSLVAAKLTAGCLLTIDYGRRMGGLPNPPRSYHKHRIETDDLTDQPGLRDLTASVDFDGLIEGGKTHGLELVSFTTLGRFLIEGGIADWLSAPGDESVASYQSRAKVKTLIHPDGMGDVFKVLIQRKKAGESQ
jgi:SAM-dependent MidA family methyltransferase